MEKQVILFNESEPKKHSVRFRTRESEVAVSDIYIRRMVLGSEVPKAVMVTIEEIDETGWE